MVTATETAVNQRNTKAAAYLCYLGAIETTRWSVEQYDGSGIARRRTPGKTKNDLRVILDDTGLL